MNPKFIYYVYLGPIEVGTIKYYQSSSEGSYKVFLNNNLKGTRVRSVERKTLKESKEFVEDKIPDYLQPHLKYAKKKE